MTRFNMFTDEELDAMESAFCNEELKYLVDEIRRERRYREASTLVKAYRKGYYDAMMCELNKRKIELENQLNMSVQNSIENEMNMCCCSTTEGKRK